MKTTVYFHDAMVAHDPGGDHPERPERLSRLREHLLGAAPAGVLWREPPAVRRESLAWVHSPHYVEGMLELAGQSGRLDSDTATPLAAYLNGGKQTAESLRGSASEADFIVCEGSPAALRGLASPY